MKSKIKCNCCLKEKEEYVSGLCEECADKIDKHILNQNEKTINKKTTSRDSCFKSTGKKIRSRRTSNNDER